MTEWWSAKELAGLPSMPGTERGIQKKAQTEQWLFQDVPAKGGPGGKRREYHISSLPDETRTALIEREAGITAPDEGALQDYLSARRITLSPAELDDPATQRKITCARAFEACPAYQGRERLLTSMAAHYNVSPITIRRWVDDVTAMQTRKAPRITLGDERVELPDSSAFSPEALACGLSSYASDMKAGMKAAYNKLLDLQTDRAWKLGDYVSFTRIVQKIPGSVWLRIRKGATGFELHGLPKIIREWTAIPVQSVLCGDQKIFDYVTYDPETDTLIKPEGYFWMDCSSRMVTGVWIEMSHYNQYTVANSLREALRYGIPDEIFTDWGKPEGAKHISHIRQGLSGFSTTDDFFAMQEKYGDVADYPDHRKAQPGKPWMKPIENIMNLIDTRLKAKNIPGFRKRDPQDAWHNKEVQDLLKRQAKQGRLLPITDFITTVFTVIEEHNKAEKKLKEGGSIVPLDFFVDGLMKQSRPVFDNTTLDYVCLPTFERLPRNSQVHVTIKGEERSYQSHILSGWRKGKVRISVDPYDRDKPAVLTDASGNYLDLAEPWHVQNPYDQAGTSAKRHRQAELMKWVGEQAKRVKTGFDLYQAPEVKDKEVIKVTSATATAHRIDEEKKVYQLRKYEAKQEKERIEEIASIEQKALEREFAELSAQADEIDGWSLPEGRERYAYWLTIKHRVELNQPLTENEEIFYTRYPHTGDYRTCHSLYEDYGDIYIGGTV